MNLVNKIKSFVSTINRNDILTDQNEYHAKLRQLGAKIGNKCRIFSDIIGPETYLISIEDNVTIASGVKIITHDNSISKHCPEFTDLFGRVIIRKNAFVGAYTILLPGVTIGSNSIVAAGSVVTKSIPENEVWGGVPAKRIGDVSEFIEKNKKFGIDTRNLSYDKKKELLEGSDLLIIR